MGVVASSPSTRDVLRTTAVAIHTTVIATVVECTGCLLSNG